MASREQALNLDPPGELRFRGPFSDVVTADLKLTNPTDKRICFKVKTTAPKRYCVRPNSGILEPNKSIVVAVMLQPFEYDPTEKNKHKFMVQSMFAPDHVDQEVLWRDAPPESLMDTKLKCVFEMPEGAQHITSETSKLSESAAHYSESNIEDSAARKVESPKKMSASNSDEARKLQLEVKKLQAELQTLKNENKDLKVSQEDGQRLRKLAYSDTVSSTPAPSPPQPSTNNIQAFPPMVYIVVAILLGLIIGKFLL